MRFSNEFLLPHTLTHVQDQVLIGGLLGDFSLSKDGKYPRLKIDRQIRDKPYLEWQFNLFNDLCKSGIKEIERYDKRYNKSSKQCSFRTRAVPAFLKYYDEWYINGIRKVPENIELSSLIIAIWFADDGCIIRENQKLILKFSTESFGKKGTELLSSKLEERYKNKFPIYRKKKDKDQFIIKTSTIPAQAVLKDIQKHIIEINMLRKYNLWKDLDLNRIPIIGRPKNENF